MFAEKIKKIFSTTNVEQREFAFNYCCNQCLGEKEFLDLYFKSVKKNNYSDPSYLLSSLQMFFNKNVLNSEANFLKLFDFYKETTDEHYQKGIFNLIYGSPVEYQKKYINFNYFSINEKEILKELWETEEDLQKYAIDELFLTLFTYFYENDDLMFIDLNHRYIESIITSILNFSHFEKIAYIEKSFRENLGNNTYIKGYLIYLCAFLKDDSLIPFIIDNIIQNNDLNKIFLTNFLKIWKNEDVLNKLIEKDLNCSYFLQFFDLTIIEKYFNNLLKMQLKSQTIDILTEVAINSFYFDGLKELQKLDKFDFKKYKEKIETISQIVQ